MRSFSARVLNLIRYAAIAEDAEPLQCEAGTGAIPHESLAPFIVVSLNTHGGLNVEAIQLRCERPMALGLEPPLSPVVLRDGALLDPHEAASAKCDLRAGVQRTPFRRFVRALLGRALVDEPSLSQPAERASSDALHDKETTDNTT
jgi:hypothetical protein